MKTVNKTTAAVLDFLTEGLAPGQSREVDNEPGVWMAVHADCMAPGLYRVGHYFRQNGDLCPDPEMVFLRAEVDGERYWLPVEGRFATGSEFVYMELDEHCAIKGVYRPKFDDACEFANLWMRNIKRQQGLRLPSAKAAA